MASYGILAEFENPHELLIAAEKVKHAGFTKFDCYSPFPVHGLDHAMGMKKTRLGFIAFTLGLIGCIIGVALQWWSSAIEYPVIVSDKPLFSLEAFIPVIFELTILLTAFGAVFGMFALNKLPTHYHPLFSSTNFQKVTDDGFFICIEAEDQKFESDNTKKFLSSLGGKNIEVIRHE